MVCDSNYDWCCFAFDTSRNMAKLSVARKFGNEYTEMRCKTLKKGVNVPFPMIVTHPDDITDMTSLKIADMNTKQIIYKAVIIWIIYISSSVSSVYEMLMNIQTLQQFKN